MSDELEGGDLAVMEGAEGQLFLQSYDGHPVVDMFVDPDSMADALLEWPRILRRRREYLAERGTAYLTLVVPDACRVLADKLPAGLTLAPRSPFERLYALLDPDTQAQCCYPFDDLVKGQATRPTYLLTDTHWSDWGAYLGYRAAMKALEAQLPVETVQPERLSWEERGFFGSLGATLTPERSERVAWSTVRDARSHVVRHVMTERREDYLVVEQDRPELPTAVIFRDSFMTNAHQFFSESFRRIVYVTHTNGMYFDLLEEEKPDVVVFEIAERRLWSAPEEPSPHDARLMFGDLILDTHEAFLAQLDSRSKAATGDMTGALADNENALAINGPTTRLLVWRARLLRGLGKNDAAVEALRTSVTLDPDDAPARYLLGTALLEKGQSAAALEEARAATRLEPRYVEFWSLAVSVAIQAGDNDLAVEIAREAVEQHPSDHRTHSALSQALLAAHKLDDAEGEARQALELRETSFALGQLASILIRQGELAEARERLARLQELDPDAPGVDAYLNMVEQRLAAT